MENNVNILKEKQAMLERQSKSGVSIQSFCKSEGIAYHSFFYWKKKLNSSTTSHPKFIDLGTAKNNSSLVIAEVVSTNGTRILWYDLPDVLFLKSLIS